jgi:peptide/nickel transport system substrate-binding protein
VEFNASDVAFTYSLIQNDSAVIDYWRDIGMFMEVPEAEIINASTVAFHLDNMFIPFLDLIWMIPIIPKHLYEGTDLLTNPYNESPIGTGPFRFVNWTDNVGISLEANEEYFNGRPYLDNVLIRWDIPSEDLPGFLRNNIIDIIPDVTDPSRITEVNQVVGVSIRSGTSPAFWTLGINLSHPILSKLEVRQALAHTLNLSRMCEESYLSYALPADGPVPPSMTDWYNPNVTRYEYNLTRAEDLLDFAGYPRDPETGVRFEIGLKVGDWDAYRINASKLVKDYLEDAGIAVTLSIAPISNFFADFDLVVTGFRYHGADPDLYSLWHTDGIENFWDYNNTQVNSLVEQALITLNRTQRRQIYYAAQEILAAELPTIFLYHQVTATAHHHDFYGFPEHTCIDMLAPIVLEQLQYASTLTCQGQSSIRIGVIDSSGNRSGFWNGSILTEISRSEYNEDQELVIIRFPLGNYTVQTQGMGNDTYNLEVVNIALDYRDIQILPGTIREDCVRQYLLELSADGAVSSLDYAVDVDGDNDCDIFDIVLVCNAYGSRPGDPNWNVLIDITPPIDLVSILDVVVFTSEYGEDW